MPSVRYIYHVPLDAPDAASRLRTAGQRWKRLARDDCPVDTGRLRNSIYYKVIRLVSRWKLECGTKGVKYAAYQEERQSFAKDNFDYITQSLDDLKQSPQQERIRRQSRRFDTFEQARRRIFNR